MHCIILGLIVWDDIVSDIILIVGQCDIFHGPVILVDISNIFSWFCITLDLLQISAQALEVSTLKHFIMSKKRKVHISLYIVLGL